MKSIDYLIIGGGIAGTTAAEYIRTRNSSASIAILEAEPHPLYSKVLIPKYLKGDITRNQLFLRTLGDYVSRHIDFFPNTVVVRVDFAEHIARTTDGQIFQYKKLLIAAGGKPKEHVFSHAAGLELRMHTLDDADRIVVMLSAPHKTAGVIGEGFIGLEFLEVFQRRGIKTHLFLERAKFREIQFGDFGAALMEKHFTSNDITVHPRATQALPISTELLGIGIGLICDTTPFAGIAKNRGVRTNEYLETSHPDVYAAGDIAEFFDAVTGEHRIVGNWANAFLQGKIAGQNMTEDRALFTSKNSYRITTLGYSVAFVGDTDHFDATGERFLGYQADKPSFVRVFLRKGKICGALCINAIRYQSVFSDMIGKMISHHELEILF